MKYNLVVRKISYTNTYVETLIKLFGLFTIRDSWICNVSISVLASVSPSHPNYCRTSVCLRVRKYTK